MAVTKAGDQRHQLQGWEATDGATTIVMSRETGPAPHTLLTFQQDGGLTEMLGQSDGEQEHK